MTDNASTLTDDEMGFGKVAPPTTPSTQTTTLSDADMGFEPPARGLKGWARDIGAGLIDTAIAVPELAVGLADIPTGGRVGKFLENEGGVVGFRPKLAREITSKMYSEATQEAERKFQEADGIVNKAITAVQNPSIIAKGVGTSLGSMGAGGVAARGLMGVTRLGQMGAKGAAIAGGLGEGATMAGAQASAIRQETEDGLLTPTQAGLALGTGALGTAFGIGGARAAHALGVGNVDTMLAQGTKGMAKEFADDATTAAAQGVLQQKALKGIPRQVIEGAIAEGLLEELPQSVAEQVLQNIALGKPWHEEADSAIVMGTLTGGAMGAGAAGYSGFARNAATKGNLGTDVTGSEAEPDGQPSAPANPGVERLRSAFADQLAAERAAGTNAPVLDEDVMLANGIAPQTRIDPAQMGKWLDTPAQPVKPSEAMGLDPKKGALSAAAALAVDSGASQSMQAAAQLDPADDPSSGSDNPVIRSMTAAAGQQQTELSGYEVDYDSLSPVERALYDWEMANQDMPDEAFSSLANLNDDDIPFFDHPSNTSEADFLRALGATDEEINDALQVTNQPRGAQSGTAGNAQAQTDVTAGARPGSGQAQGQVSTGDRIKQLEALAAAADAEARDWATREYKHNAKPLPAHEAKGGPGDVGEANEQRRLKAISDAQGRAATARAEITQLQEQANADAALAGKSSPAFKTGAATDGTQTPQTQQAKPKQRAARPASGKAVNGVPAAAQAADPAADQGLTHGGTTSQNNGGLAGAKAKTKGAADATAIAQAGNASRAAQSARKLEASERWTRMTTVERQAVTANAPGLNAMQRKNLHTRPWADMTDKTRAALLDAIAPIEPVASQKQAKPEGDEKQFAPETGTLGIPRAEMPQVPTQSHGGLVKHLNAQGIAHETTTVDAAALKPTQAEYSPSKVAKAKEATGDRAVIVSNDGHIIDGHHQAMAAAEDGKPVKAIVLDAPVEQALEAVKNSPSASADAQKALFRRSDADSSQDFDVPGFLKTMNHGQPVISETARARVVDKVKGTADAIRKVWAHGPEVVVAYDMADPIIPEAVRRADQKQRSGGASGEPEGFYHEGKAYLLASQLKTPNDAARVLFHEALGHHGLRGAFGKELDSILDQIATMRKADVDAKIQEYGLRDGNLLDRRIAAEEVLAEMAQIRPDAGFVKRAVAAIRTWLRQNVPGFQSLRLTDAEIINNYILPARAWVERGGFLDRDTAGAALFSRGGSDIEKARVLQGEPVATVDTSIAPMGAPAIRSWASDLFEKQGGKAHHPVLGDVRLDERAVRSSIAHGRPNAYKVAAFVAVKDVLERGALVASTQHDDKESFYVSAPVQLSGTDHILTALVHRDTRTQRMYLHSVATKESLLNRRVSRAGAEASRLSGSNDSGDVSNLPSSRDIGKLSSEEVASELQRLLTLNIDQPADDVMFSRSRLADLKDKGMTLAHNALSHPGKVSLWDKTVGTMRHISERYPAFKPVFESAQQFIDDVSSVANQAAQVAPRLIPRVETLGDMLGKNRKRAISVGDNKAIGKALFGGTLDWGRDQHGKAMPMDALRAKYQGLTVDQKAEVLLAAKKIDPQMMAAFRAKKLDQFETIINNKFESTILKAGAAFNHKELKEFFNLNDQQISLYDEARATVDKSLDITARAEMLRTLGRDWDGMRDIVMDAPTLTEAWKLLDDELEHRAKQYPDTRDRLATQMQQLSTILSKAQELMDHGYMPLQRFGKYTVFVQGADGESLYYGMFESMADSNKMFQTMAREFPDAKVTQGTINEEKFKLMAGITPETAELFGSMLGLDAEGNQEKDKAFQEYLKLAKNNHSAMKRLIHRKGILGYSDDVGRVLASFVYSNARVSATGLNAGKMETAINDLNTKHKEEGELGKIAAKLRSYIQDPQEEGQAIRGMLFAQYLGGSLASAAVNMTQPFAVTLPWLSQYGGMAKASKYMSGALRDMVKRGNKYEPDLAHALRMAEDDGVVSPQEIHQLMAQARGAGGLRTGDGTKLGDARAVASNAWEKGKVAWGQPFALAEQFNRRSTFIAAYRLARDNGMDSPAQFARDAVVETQFLYTKANKPQWARGAVGGTLFTFKTYSVSFLELMQRTWNAGEAGSPERAAGRRAVGWAMLMLMLMGGAGGMPFVEDVEDLLDGAGQMMGYNLSSKQWRKDLMREVLGAELAEFMDSGLSGMPGAPIDVSGRLGMGNLIPGTGLLLSKQSNTRDVVEMMGPAGDLVARGFSGAKSVVSGVINRDAASIGRGAMEVMPNAVRNAAKGADMAASGIYKDTKGYKVIDTSLDEALWKAIGFQPRSVAEVQESNSFMQRAKSFYTQTSNDIRAQWAKALFEKDEAGVVRVRERLAQWNAQNPDQPIRINMPDIWKRARQMGKDRTARIADTAPTAIRQQMRDFAARG
ncbi:PLxRFG domain-containing protein [Comamonas sp.]|uniref:PLxRFG domain-containing protein n=1 Tax=Comamonas sp. TaxID=34028 RepID=UPI00258BD1B0|nr:PLxRFG domain-containing protein [Comamonas sp.]